MCASAPVQVFVALAWVAYLQNPNPLAFFPFLLSIWISPECPEQLKPLLLMTHAILLPCLDGRKLKVRYNVTNVAEHTRIMRLPDSDIQQPLKYWLVTFTLLSAILIKNKFLLQLISFFLSFFFFSGLPYMNNPKATWNMWWQATDPRNDLESSSLLNI